MCSNKRALEGIRIIDLTRVLAGPFCTMLLADLGAEVIKVEVPEKGDDTRKYPPFIGSESAYFMNLNRNKKSITLNLKKEEGKGVFFDLVSNADVVIENFRPGTMDKLGIGYDKIKVINPNIIFSSISGFGQTGPYKDLPGYDIIGQAMGGIMSVTGWPDSPPTRTGTAIADILGGLFTCIGILTGLLSRQNISCGQSVDVSLVDSVVSAMETILQIYLVEGRIPEPTGNRYEFIYPYDSFKAKDGWVVIGIGNDKLWHEFCKIIGRTEILEREEFNSNESRVKNHIEVKEIVEKWTIKANRDTIIDFLREKGIPCAPIYTVEDIIKDKHIAGAREMVLDVEHSIAGKTKIIGSPIKLSETPSKIITPAPNLGEHTEEVLSNLLSYSKEYINELKEKECF